MSPRERSKLTSRALVIERELRRLARGIALGRFITLDMGPVYDALDAELKEIIARLAAEQPPIPRFPAGVRDMHKRITP